jgi:2-polyprenyl-3-methyl-5-hydroxy-6-metoxy-1,4-benzoquinol methylase
VRSDYGEAYREIYDRHWWWRAREAMILDVICRRHSIQGSHRILDVGCGDGLFFDQLLKFGAVQGIESSAELVSPSGRHRNRIHIGRFDERFEPRERFSLILMLDVLEHMEDPVAALRRAWSLLEPGGTLLITVPAFMLLWTQHDVLNHHLVRYTKSSIRRVAEAAGVKLDSEMYMFHWLFLVKAAVRIKESVLKASAEVPQIPPEWLNKILFRLSWAEYRALRGIRLPFGNSLMVIAQKPTL